MKVLLKYLKQGVSNIATSTLFNAFKIKPPILSTFHDMWFFIKGSQYNDESGKSKTSYHYE